MEQVMNRMREGVCAVARGVGQVMLQENAFSGLLMLAGIACTSWQWAGLALAGNVAGTLAALALRCAKEDVRAGLYGFNGTLVGIAAGVFLKPGWALLPVLLAFSFLSTWIACLWRQRRWRLPALTAPFILAVWLMLAACRAAAPGLLLPQAALESETEAGWLQAFCLNVGQVMFAGGSLWTGLLFLAGVAVNSSRSFGHAVWGAVLPLSAFLVAGADCASVNAGLWGYNAVLCAVALGDGTRTGFFRATLACVLSMALQAAGLRAGFPTLTAPFVLSVWAVSEGWRWHRGRLPGNASGAVGKRAGNVSSSRE